MDFHDLYTRYAHHVRRFALFLSGDHALADDVTSETFVRAWIAQGRIEQETVKAYLFAIARNLCRDFARDARRYAPLGAQADPGAEMQTELEIKSELRAVLTAMQQLPESDRAALLMRAHGEMPYEEIAQVLGLSLANAKVRVHRARMKLMEMRKSRPQP